MRTAPAKLITKSFTVGQLEFLAAVLADQLNNDGPCHCDRDPECKACADVRAILQMLYPVEGVCMFCLCTENYACRLDGGAACSWADEAQTICSNPDCVMAAIEHLDIAAGQIPGSFLRILAREPEARRE